MAAESNHPPEIAALLARSAAHRARLHEGVQILRERLDAPAKVARSVRSHPLRWAGGALATGLGLTMLLRRRREPAPAPLLIKAKSRGVAGLLLTLILAALKPAAKAWLAARARDFLISRLGRIPRPTPSRLRPF